MQLIGVIDLLGGVLAEPALATLLARTRIPGHRDRLQSPAGQLDEVLLQRRDAERVLDLEVRELAVGSVRADEVLAVALEEAGLDALEAVGRVVEIAEHCLSGGVLHGDSMLRGLPGSRFRRVALRAGLRADVCGCYGDFS